MNIPPHITLLAALSLAPCAHANELGRLFFSPIERKQMELQAFKERHASDSEGAPSYIAVNGIIKRNNGSRIAWINGKPQEIAPHNNPNVVAVTVQGKDKAVEVTVGERVMLDQPLPVQANVPVPRHEEMP